MTILSRDKKKKPGKEHQTVWQLTHAIFEKHLAIDNDKGQRMRPVLLHELRQLEKELNARDA